MYFCKLCGTKFLKYSFALTHLRKNHVMFKNNLNILSGVRRKYYKFKRKLIRSQLTCKNEDKFLYICGYCKRIYYNYFNIVRHSRFHTNKESLSGKSKIKSCTEGTILSSFSHTQKTKLYLNGSKVIYKVNVLNCIITSSRPNEKQSPKVKNQKPTSKASPKNLYCSKCNLNFRFPSSFYRHTKNIHKHFKYMCETCGKSFNQRDNLNIHQKKHKGEVKKLECEKCGKSYVQLRSLKAHIEAEHLGQKFVCDSCGRLFNLKHSLMSHKKSCEGVPVSKLCCDQCGKFYKSLGLLNRHITIEHSLRKFVCIICAKTYVSQSRLEEHFKRHERPFSCDICARSFSDSKKLNGHKHRHYTKKIK